MRPRERRYACEGSLARALAASIAEDLRTAIRLRGCASVVVSGGTTPKPMFECLKRADIGWDEVYVTLADERWVETSSAQSNQHMVCKTLLTGAASRSSFVGLKTQHTEPEDAVEECAMVLDEVPSPYDVVVLGMGEDGHTASLFAGSPELSAALGASDDELCCAMRPPGQGVARMTLTPAALLKSRRVVLHLTGDEKWEVYERALESGAVEDLPVRAILQQSRVPVDVYWAPHQSPGM